MTDTTEPTQEQKQEQQFVMLCIERIKRYIKQNPYHRLKYLGGYGGIFFPYESQAEMIGAVKEYPMTPTVYVPMPEENKFLMEFPIGLKRAQIVIPMSIFDDAPVPSPDTPSPDDV